MVEPLIPGWAWAVLLVFALCAAILVGLYLLTRNVAAKVDRSFPPEGRIVEVNGHALHYVDSADADPADRDKPAVLLIHGLGGQLRNFTHSLDRALRDRFRVVALDRPGAGRSTREAGSDHRLPAQASDVVAFMDALGLERPILVGHSLGGAISLAVGLDHPEKVTGLALVAPLTRPIEAGRMHPLFKSLAIDSEWRRKATSWTIAVPMGMRYGPQGLAAVFHPEVPPEDFATRGGGLLGLRPRTFQNTSRDMMAIPRSLPAQHARYGELSVPVAVIHGTKDIITPFATQAEAFAEATGARLDAVEGAGHMLPVSQPERVARFVAECAEAWLPAGTANARRVGAGKVAAGRGEAGEERVA